MQVASQAEESHVRQTIATQTELDTIRIAQIADEVLKRHSHALSDYLRTARGRTVLQKSAGRDALDPNDPTDGSTATAFVVSRIARAKASRGNGADGRASLGVADHQWESLVNTLAVDFIATYGPSDNAGGDSKAAGTLPNFYSTPLHLDGLIHSGALERQDVPDNLIEAVVKVATLLCDWVKSSPFVVGDRPTGEGMEGSINGQELPVLADGRPNWYLTYLIVDSLASVQSAKARIVDERFQRIEIDLNNARAASLLSLTRMIALSAAGLNGIFDSLDLGGCLATLGRCVSATGRADLITENLIRTGVKLLASEFITPYGAFAPKGPALVDRRNALLEVSSSELAELVLSALESLLKDDQLTLLLPAIELTCQRADGHRGWGVSGADSRDRRDVFVASSSVALLVAYTTRFEQMRHNRACSILGVEPSPELAHLDYPESLRSTISTRVVAPVDLGRRDLAAMSLLLYGPPGTAKTTIARKIASDLKWPILELTPSQLLLTGFEGITSRAEDLFATLTDLRDVVVLFDEFEGFIGRRDSDGATDASKFLTTFMLPKLHRLRDSQRIVFIVATNDRQAIDSAASRPGRIDTVLSVDPPTASEVKRILQTMARKIEPQSGSTESWIAMWSDLAEGQDEDFRDLTYGYISRWIKDVALEYNDNYNTKDALLQLSVLRERLKSEQHN